jgi:hypothetical protein
MADKAFLAGGRPGRWRADDALYCAAALPNVKVPTVAYYSEALDSLPTAYLEVLRKHVLASPYLASRNLNADFVGSKGFSVVFRRDALADVIREWPFFETYLTELLEPDCNAFYLNPLLLGDGAQVNPHIDRSLRAYCPTVETPLLVSVLYVELPTVMTGGQLVLSHRNKQIGTVKPVVNKVVRFQGDLTHHVTPVTTQGRGQRLSVVCEQYWLEPGPLAQIPAMGLESKGKKY